MQFEVNGQNYFLEFSPEENQWLLFKPGSRSVTRYDISDDTTATPTKTSMIPLAANEEEEDDNLKIN